jgi:rhodanese-related sulfurtransferase
MSKRARVLLEATGVVATGVTLALIANALSPRGLSLTRDYFPGSRSSLHAAPDPPPGDPAIREAVDVPEALSPGQERLNGRGIGWLELEEARDWFHDPRFAQELVIFVDARSRRFYQEGHIPGAYHLDHFYPGETLAEVLPAALAAERVIVYCNGGECEDSEFSAVFLLESGVAVERLGVFGGGLEAWREAGLPIEMGQRGSGVMEE